jgi:PAS domain S-box-containing protein
METEHPVPDETQALRRCVRELAALSTLSAAWSQSDIRDIADGLCRVLCRSLPATFVYVRVTGQAGTVAVEVACTPRGPTSVNQTQDIGRVLEPLLESGSPDRALTIANPIGSGTLRIAVATIGHEADCGVVVASSQQPAFPSQTDRLLLSVAANQAAIVLQQKRSEERVRHNERELTDFFENATVGLHWAAPDGIIVRANRAELDLLGYSPDEYIGHHIAEFHADKGVIEGILQRLWAGEAVADCEARMRCKDGSLKHVLISCNALWREGRFIHSRCFTRDITERKLAEETRLRLAAIVESSDDAILSKDLNGTITSWNRAAERLYGYAAEEIVGRPVSVLIPPDHIDDFPTILERLRRGERIDHYETVRVTKDGRRLDVSLTISPLRNANGEIIGASKIAHDITDRKRTGVALAKQTERLRLLWEAASVLLTADDPDAMLRGLLAKIGPHLAVDTYFNFLVNDNRDALRLASCEGIPLETARTITRLEFGQAVCGTVALRREPIVVNHIQQSDDPKVQLVKSFGLRAYACNPLMVGDCLLGTLSFASRTRDQFDPDEVAFMETICHYVTVAYERLRLLTELKEADRRKDEFLATLAHELRNPLAPVRSAVQVLRLKGPDEPELRWGRDVIDRQVDHLTRLIDDLMDISRITRNKLELRKQRVELAEVIRGAVESSRPAIEQCGHDLTVTLPPQPIHLNGDLVRLAQVFLNLLTNAAKYTEKGGRIWLTAEVKGSDVLVRVKDTGVGIPAEKLPRLFEMFFQVDRTLERSQGGLGIGLSLVRRLVELHGGKVEARSEGVGKGSEFVVRLPVLVEEPKPPPSEERSGNGKTKPAGLRVLVVDDNRDAADSLAMLLRLIGNEVHTAYDGLEGVEAVERFRPAVVLLDIGMPKLNVYDACRRIREEAWGKGMLLIAMTGWGQEEDRRRTMEAGFNTHLVKPVDPTALMKLLAGTNTGVSAN